MSFFSQWKVFIEAFFYYLANNFVSIIPSYRFRHWFYRLFIGIKIGKNSSIHMGNFITGNNIDIGNNSVINRKCYLDGRIGIKIGDNVGISPHVFIISLSHNVNDPMFKTVGDKVIIEDYVWIATRATILPGVKIGKGAVVGACSVVTKDIAPYCIVAGNPAKKIGTRTNDLKYDCKFFPYFDTDCANL